MSRVREEAITHGVRQGVLRGRLFFRRRSPRAGPAGALLLDVSNAHLVRRPAAADRSAATALVPYAAWCLFVRRAGYVRRCADLRRRSRLNVPPRPGPACGGVHRHLRATPPDPHTTGVRARLPPPRVSRTACSSGSRRHAGRRRG
ncbi:tryptophan-rich sensory protein [Streptomyces sp. NPDC054958]